MVLVSRGWGCILNGKELDQRAAEIEKMIWKEMANKIQ